MKKRILACMLIVAMVGIGVVFAAAEATDTISNLKGNVNERTSLTLNWEFNDTKETYTVGFSDKAPAAGLNQDLASKNSVDTLNIKPYEKNSDTMYKGVQDVWVYWDIYTNEAFSIDVKASGPLKFGNTSKEKFNNLINWQATWTPCSTTTQGQVAPVASGTVKLGKLDNDFTPLAHNPGNDYDNAPAEAYTNYQSVFAQQKSTTTPMAKKGFAKLAIETQNTRDSGIETLDKKDAGVYSASLTLKISTT